ARSARKTRRLPPTLRRASSGAARTFSRTSTPARARFRDVRTRTTIRNRSVVVQAFRPAKGITMKLATAVAILALAASAHAADTSVAPTFSKDVLPILQKNCQSCHRPGEIGPMPLLSFEQARPYARAIKRATETKKMPPWFADSSVQHYTNDMSLAPADISTLGAWADAGAPEGNPSD